jgi:hypothetical protein
MKNNLLIKEGVRKMLLGEEKKKSQKDADIECDELISDIRKKLMGLSSKLAEMGLAKDSKPSKQIKRMYQLLADFDPVEVKLKEFFTPNPDTQSTANQMFGESGTVKIDAEADRLDQKKAMDLANEYEKDIELLNKEK